MAKKGKTHASAKHGHDCIGSYVRSTKYVPFVLLLTPRVFTHSCWRNCQFHLPAYICAAEDLANTTNQYPRCPHLPFSSQKMHSWSREKHDRFGSIGARGVVKVKVRSGVLVMQRRRTLKNHRIRASERPREVASSYVHVCTYIYMRTHHHILYST